MIYLYIYIGCFALMSIIFLVARGDSDFKWWHKILMIVLSPLVIAFVIIAFICILPKHIDYAASLGTGRAKVTVDGAPREADVSGGMIYVARDVVRILTNSFAWKG